MKRLQKAALISEVLDKMIEKGSWAGETHLQKCLFFLQEMRDVSTGYIFQIHHYGPFSFDLSDEIVQLKGDRLIVPFYRPYPYGPSLASSEAGRHLRNKYFPETLRRYTDDIDFVIKHFGDLNANELGELSTAYYFILRDKNSSDVEIAEKVNKAKPYISIPDGIKATKKVREIAFSTEAAASNPANGGGNTIAKDSSAEIDGWRDWIQGDIAKQVYGIKLKCIAFASWKDIVEIASPKNSLFFEWVVENHIKTLAVDIRTMYDKDKRTRSLRVLMDKIRDKVHILTREWWISRFSINNSYYEQAYESHVRRFGEISVEGGDHLDPEIVCNDIKKLDQIADSVKLYVNKHVAHLDKNRPNPDLTIGGLHEEADKLYQMFHRWHDFLCNTSSTVPSVEQWETDFTKPWITFEQASEISNRRQAEAEELEKQLRRQAIGATYLPDGPRPF